MARFLGLSVGLLRILALGILALAPVTSFAQDADRGTISGRVFDGETGAPIHNATVILTFPDPGDGSEPGQEIATSGPAGDYEFGAVAAGAYVLSFVKSGYRASSITSFEVVPGQDNVADFPLPPQPTAASGDVLELDAFVVEASVVADMMNDLELRMESDQVLNIFSAQDLAKYAASDVADALKRVAGVNIVEGQFAIIRGLEDRYSSTLYNGAPIPSPDPDRQSVQLDLFPSDIVSTLSVEKTFAPQTPSNSSGGSIDIISHDYPEEVQVKLSVGTGFNENAIDRFLRLDGGSPVGIDAGASDTVNRDLSLSLGGRRQLLGRELRAKVVIAHEVDYETAIGWQEDREPRPGQLRLFPRPPTVVRSGDLALGELNLTGGRFDLTESTRAEQTTAYAGVGFDLDRAGRHRIDVSLFHTRKQEETAQLRENGFLPGFDYANLAARQQAGLEINPNADFDGYATLSSWIARTVRSNPANQPSRGPLWYASFLSSSSFERDRDLLVTQVNGDHEFESLEGLSVRWATNYARARQDDSALKLRFFVEPDDTSVIPSEFPVTPAALGSGRYAANNGIFGSRNDVDERQGFARIDVDYELDVTERVELTLSAGGWYESSTRSVVSEFLQSPTVDGNTQFAVFGDSPRDLVRNFFSSLDREAGRISGDRLGDSEFDREIAAGHFRLKTTLWDRLDLIAGLRVEQISIDSRNDAFTGELAFDGSPGIFPNKWLFFDRLDNPARSEISVPPAPGTTFNDQLLGIDVPVDPQTGLVDLVDANELASILNGEIDELKLLPMAGITVRPFEGWTLRGAYSQTTARPSFRELGYYVTVEPDTDDLIVGNPQLELSDVESFDVRLEYVWGGSGDLVALSGFSKRIERPIESIVLRDPTNLDGGSSALFRTFFNNPSEAELLGIEAEFRAGFGFLDLPLLEDLSIGGNATYISASVDRSPIELVRSQPFFGAAAGDVEKFSQLNKKRRLFGQPEWIANADLTFDREAWGFRATLAVFAISDVLDAAGSTSLRPDGSIQSLTLDRYVDSYYQLDLVVSQTLPVPWIGGDITLRASAKNLTDSTRRIVYDRSQTVSRIAEREFQVGRDYSFAVAYALRF